MLKVVTIDNKKIPMKSDGYTGRLYARLFSKDFLESIFKLKDIDKENVKSEDLSMLEELAYVLAKSANPKLEPFDAWLGQFDGPFSILQASTQFIELLIRSTNGTVKPKKKKKRAQN